MSATSPPPGVPGQQASNRIYAAALAITTAVAGCYVLGHTVSVVRSSLADGFSLPVAFSAGAAISLPSSTGAHLALSGATATAPPGSLSAGATSLLVVGIAAGALAALAGLALVGTAGWKLLMGTLWRARSTRALSWLATSTLLGAVAALGATLMGANWALADLGFDGSQGVERGPVPATSPWVWIALMWAALLVARAWQAVRRMARDTEGLV